MRSTTNVLALVVLFLCGACAVAPPSPTPTASDVPTTSPFNTSVAPDVRPTLPPTWTLTSTLTPSRTPLPTHTPSPTATLSLSDLCATLQVDFPYEDGHVFESDDTLLLVFGTAERWWESQIQAVATSNASASQPTRPPAVLREPVMVRFLVVHRETGENLGAQAAGGELLALDLPINQLPLAGVYDWMVSIYIDSLGEQCTHTGTFVVAEATDEP